MWRYSVRTGFATTVVANPPGPYSPVVRAGDYVFVSGLASVDPATGEMTGMTVHEQTQRTLLNIATLLQSAGARLEDVVQVTVHLRNIEQYEEMNGAYAAFFAEPYPARTTVQCQLLPGCLVEIDCIAHIGR